MASVTKSSKIRDINARIKLNEVNHKQQKKEIEISKNFVLDTIEHEQKTLAENLARLQLEKEYHTRNKYANSNSDHELRRGAGRDFDQESRAGSSLSRSKSSLSRKESFGSIRSTRSRSSTDPNVQDNLSISSNRVTFADERPVRRKSKEDIQLPIYDPNSGSIISPPVIYSRRGPCLENPDWIGNPDAIQSIRRSRKTIGEQRLMRAMRTPERPISQPLPFSASQSSFGSSEYESRYSSSPKNLAPKMLLRRTNSDRPAHKDEALRKLRSMSLNEKVKNFERKADELKYK